MKGRQIPEILRLRTIYYIFPFWMTAVLCLGQNIAFNDLGHYLKLGGEMIERKALVSQDILTHTFSGLAYVNSGWLPQVVLAGCERLGGLHLLALLRICILVFAMLFYYRLIQKLVDNYKITLIFIVYAAAIGFTNWGIRPQLFIIPLFIYLYSFLYQRREITGAALAGFALIMILWVNLHSSFPLAILLIATFFAGEIPAAYGRSLALYAGRRERLKGLIHDARLRVILFLLLTLSLATLINPYGIDIWKDAWTNASVSTARSAEWQPTQMEGFAGYCFVASIIVAGIILKYSKRKITFTELLLLLVFMFAGFKSLRMILWWGIVSAPILAVHFCSIDWVVKKIPAPRILDKSKGEWLPMNILLAAMMLAVLVAYSPWFRSHLNSRTSADFIDRKSEPVEIARYIKKQGFKGNMFNNVNWGSYLAWALWPDQKVFADLRLHIIPEKIFEDYIDAAIGRANWEKIMDKYEISWAVLSKKENKRLIEFISESARWERAYEDELGAIFVRR